jgi:hypothetical protein
MGGVDPLPWRPEETYYVIVGCGLTAAVNFTTLLATYPARLANLPVLFVGDDEPWSQYAQMPMGQWPAVLAPASFRDRLRSVPQHQFLAVPDFAAAIDRQWQYLAGQHPFAALRGHVRRITSSHGGGFDVTLEDGRSINAALVDVCGGPGPARRLCNHQVDPALRPYPSGAAGPAGWKLLETGESFLNRGTVVATGQRVAIYGGGPTAAWCVERALAGRCDVTWIGDAELNPAFVSSLRNDALAQGPLVRHRRYHTSVVRQPVFPASPRLRFAEGYVIDRVAPSATAPVRLTFVPAPGATTRYVDSHHVNLGALGFLECDQAVIAIGQETNRRKACPAGCGLHCETGSWATMLDPLLAPAFKAFQHFILDPADGLPAGLQTLDGALRVLGAAFLAHPVTQRNFRYKRSVLFRYLVSLCEQAQVDRGAAMTAYTTARANAWFRRRGNRNRHSATLGELQALLNFNREHARRWHAVRSYRVDPFTAGELAALRRSTRDR